MAEITTVQSDESKRSVAECEKKTKQNSAFLIINDFLKLFLLLDKLHLQAFEGI